MEITKNLKVWLSFNESPTKNFDGENWTAYGNPTINKNFLQLDGESYIQSGEIELGGQDFTVDGWCYTDSNCVGGARIFNIHLSPDTGNSLVQLRHPTADKSSKWRLMTNTLARVGGNLNTQDSGVDPTGNLHHFAVVYQYAEKIMTFYIDGMKKAQKTKCPQYNRQKFIVDVGTQIFSSTEKYFFTGTVDEFRIYDGVALWAENFTPPSVDYYKNIEIEIDFDVERKIKNPALTWKYKNYGSVDFLTVSGTTLSNLPKNKSVFGSAFFQTSRQKCFDIAATKEIWIKFDVFTTLSNRWRAYNDDSNGANGICSQTDGRLTFWLNDELSEEFSNAVKNELQTYLLHMKSDSSNGILEVWQDGEKIFSYNGNVNNGENFADVYLQSDGSGTFFSNVIISNGEIDLNEIASLVGVLWTWNFDTERKIFKSTENFFDIERKIFNKVEKNFDIERRIFNKIEKTFDVERILKYAAERQEFYFDIERKLFSAVELNFDIEIKFPHYITDFSGIYQEIQIEITSQQLTDRLTLTNTKPMNILEQVRGQYLDYFFDVRIEETTQRGILTTCQCCSDIDEILYTQFDYEIGEDYVGYASDVDKKELRRLVPSTLEWKELLESEELIKKAYASSHLSMIAQALNKDFIMQFGDFISDMEIEQKNITYADLLSNLFGWTSRLPQMKINCYLRDDKLFAIQRGFEKNKIDLTDTEHTMPTINKTLMRTTWGSSADSTYTLNKHHGGHYLRPPPRKISDDGRTTYHYRRIHPHGYLLTGSTTHNDDGSYETTSYTYSYTLPYELLTEVHERYEPVYVTQDDGYEAYAGVECVERTVTHHTSLTPSQRHTQTFDEDGNEMAGVLGSHVAGFYDNPITLWEPYDETKEITIDGNPLIDTSFPVVDVEKLKELTAAIKWLNRKIQETISFDVYNYPHVIDFNDKIIFDGNEYFLESNTVSKNARIVNKQSLSFVRWY